MSFNEALKAATEQIKQGHAVSYHTDSTRLTGIRLFLETDQGWNPEPFWQEFTPESWES